VNVRHRKIAAVKDPERKAGMKILRSRAGVIVALAIFGALLPGLAGCGGTRALPGAKTPMIVDTDMSSDDIMALTYLLERSDVTVRAITVEGTGVADGKAGARNVLRLINALGIRRAIPVAFGRSRPLAGTASFPRPWRAAADQMYGLKIPQWSGAPAAATAVGLLERTLNRSSRPVSLVTLGPLTDVALALRASTRIAGKIAGIYAMAGAVGVPGNEPTYHRAEWNAYIDPKAAGIVLRSGVPITVVPLDASNYVPITTFFTAAVRAHQDTIAMRLLATLLNDPVYTHSPVYFWDPLTAVAATDGRVLRQRPALLIVTQAPGPGYGETSLGRAGAPVTLGTAANPDAFARDYLSTLNAGRTVAVPTVPDSQRLAVSYSGSGYTYRIPQGVTAGEIAVRLTNLSADPAGGFQFVVGKLAAGKTLSDVKAVIKRGHVTAAPRWFQVMSVLPAPPGATAVWGIALPPGRYAFVAMLDASSALRALAEIRAR
jgi:pyrimidine-specific ribonucleoside hydrolase